MLHSDAPTEPKTSLLTVEIWADIICPWCGLGEHRFETALERFAHRDNVEVIHRSFQLDPTLPLGATRSVREYLSRKLGTGGEAGIARIEAMTRNIESMAEHEGLQPYHVLENRTGNTSLAHELLAYATEHGRHAEAWREVSRAYFGEQKSIFDTDSLVDLAGKMGLDAAAVREALETRQYRGKVEKDGEEAQELGATGVPFFVIDRRYGVVGAQGADVLLGAMQKAWHEAHPLQGIAGATSDMICTPEGCLPTAF